jgi:hypothetical protein
MAGRKRLPDHLLKYPRKAPKRKNKVRAVEQRGRTYKEPILIKSFWKDYTIDQVQEMTDEQLIQAIDKYLEGFIYRQQKREKNWDFPLRPEYLSIAPYNKK